jgi:hypothetical protein
LIDYGNQEEKLVSELFELPAALAQPPPFGRLVRLPLLGLLDNTPQNKDSLHHILTRLVHLIFKFKTVKDKFSIVI